jgi:NADH-quinone oxidoreductase subunit B
LPNEEQPHAEEEFLNAEQQMTKLVEEAAKKYNVENNVLFANLREVTKNISSGMINWSREKSLWPMQFGLACCAMELMDFGSARIDAERKGYLMFRGTPRQCDVMVVAGWVTKSIIPRIKRLYEQMAEPKYVIAYGECATSGGPWWESYNIIQGIDQVLPVDVYVVGCPPRPENLFAAFMKLQNKIGGRSEGDTERGPSQNMRKYEKRRL